MSWCVFFSTYENRSMNTNLSVSGRKSSVIDMLSSHSHHSEKVSYKEVKDGDLSASQQLSPEVSPIGPTANHRKMLLVSSP